MKGAYAYRPFRFFLLTFLLTWTTWLSAAFFSYRKGAEALQLVFMALGLLAPLGTALWLLLTSGSRELKRDFVSRLLDLRLFNPGYLAFTLLLMPVVAVAAILLSLPAGQSIEQLRISREFGVMVGQPGLSLIIPFLAAALEEVAWSGYGIDSLRSKSNVLTATLLFAVIWSFWHLPLFFIKGYYHYTLWQTNAIYAVNFFVALIPLTIIKNWLFFRNHRSIIAAIVFHALANLSGEIFQITDFTKCFVTLILAAVAAVIVARDRDFFTKRGSAFAPAGPAA